ncbi:glycosyltransferase [Micromonospora sp. NPDC047134]|uniref:glycosyltransferase family 2 protein n=1 Tax=Micromonospora sp. NPDC047134 TaxID=3154340 RepID=UPI0033F4ECD8
MAELSVVIPTRDKAASLRATLSALAAAVVPADTEVIVVDDGSDDSTAAVLDTFVDRPGWSVVAGPRRGRAAARNAGAAAATGRQLVFLDDDVLVGRTFLLAHRASARPDTFVHGPLREFPAARRWLAEHVDTPPAELARYAAQVLAADGHRLLRNTLETLVLAMGQQRVPPVAPWLACIGANTAVPRKVFEAVGGFDEDFGLGWGCEDLELGVRLVAAGLAARVVDRAAGVHLTHARPGRWSQHDANLERFVGLHDLPAVRLLPVLLGEGGGVRQYLAALGVQDRQTGVPAS